MKLDHLRYFDRLADMLSYTNAAKSLYIAQPTLSAAIKRMEHEVGLTLFRRAEGVASGVELTEQGRIFHEYVVQALERYDTGLNLALESQNESDSLLRLGTVYSMKIARQALMMNTPAVPSEVPMKNAIHMGLKIPPRRPKALATPAPRIRQAVGKGSDR